MILTQETQTTDRFVKAAELLKGPGIEVRLAGIYSLERLARDSAKAPGAWGKDYATIIEYLAGYVRHRSPWPSRKKRDEMLDDVQAALTVLGRRPKVYKSERDPRLHLSATDLRWADLREAHLEGAYLHRVHLEDADLGGAHLHDAILIRAHFQGASLAGAHLERAHLEGAYLAKTTGITLHQVKSAYFDNDTQLPPDIRTALAPAQPANPPTTPPAPTIPPLRPVS